MDEKKGRGPRYTIHIDCTELDVAIEKANRLTELLREASNIIDSLSHRDPLAFAKDQKPN